MWSRVASGRPRAPRLQRVRGAQPRPARARPKAGLFDPDVGHDAARATSSSSTPAAPASPAQAATSAQYDGFALQGAQGAGRVEPRRCSEFAPSVWLGSVAFARTGPGQVQRPVRRAPRASCASSTPASRPTPTCAAAASPTCSSRPATRSAARSGCARCATSGSRVVVTGFAAEGESYAVIEPGARRPLHLLALRRTACATSSSPGAARSPPAAGARVHAAHVPGARRLDRDRRRERFYYTNGRGVYLATDPPPIFARPAALESPRPDREESLGRRTDRQAVPAVRVRGRAREDPRVRERGGRDEPRPPRPRGGAGGRLPQRRRAADVLRRLLRRRDGPGDPRPRARAST